MNKCESKSIGEEIENALSEISVYEESSETEISGTEEKEVFQTEDKSVEQSVSCALFVGNSFSSK